MAKLTLLAIVQDILSSMNGDEVNSISDTVESLQVARAVVACYYELYAGRDTPSSRSLIKLDASIDLDKPTYLKLPDNVKRIDWVKYKGEPVKYVQPEEFLYEAHAIAGNPNTILFPTTFTSTHHFITNNQDPTTWTTFDNEYLVFNSYNAANEATLQRANTLCWGQLDPLYVFNDNAYAPYIDGDEYPGLLAEARSYCFINLKQVSNSKAEQQAKRQQVRQQNDLWRADQRRPYNRTPNYGRNGKRV